MRFLRYWSDDERWHWFAAGDEARAAPTPHARARGNAASQVIFEIGLTFAVPLALAALASAWLGR